MIKYITNYIYICICLTITWFTQIRLQKDPPHMLLAVVNTVCAHSCKLARTCLRNCILGVFQNKLLFFSWERTLLTLYWSSILCSPSPILQNRLFFCHSFFFFYASPAFPASRGWRSAQLLLGKCWSIGLNIKWLMNKRSGAQNALQ